MSSRTYNPASQYNNIFIYNTTLELLRTFSSATPECNKFEYFTVVRFVYKYSIIDSMCINRIFSANNYKQGATFYTNLISYHKNKCPHIHTSSYKILNSNIPWIINPQLSNYCKYICLRPRLVIIALHFS